MPLSPNNRSCAPDTSAARDFGHRSAAGHVDRTAAHVNQGAIPVSWPSRSTAPRAYKERVPAGWRGSNRGSGVSSSARTATGFDSSSHLKPDSGRPRRPGPAPIRASEGLRAPVAMVVSPRPERAGQADQDGRPSGAALPAIDLSVVRGVGSSMVVPGSVGSYRPVIAGAKLREGTTTILPRERALQGVGLSSMRFHPIGGGPKTTKMDKKHGSRQESHPLSDRPEFEWPCRT